MAQLSVELSQPWAKVSTKELIGRVEAILIGPRTCSFEPFEKDGSEGIWQIDSDNNWTAHVRDGVLYLTGRYASENLMSGLKSVLKWAVGV
jgi:hypothetical protein